MHSTENSHGPEPAQTTACPGLHPRHPASACQCLPVPASQILIFCTTLPVDTWLYPEMPQAPEAHVSPQRLADCSAYHPRLFLEHSTNQTFGGKKCPPTKGQGWLSPGQRGLGGTLPPAGERGWWGAWGVALALPRRRKAVNIPAAGGRVRPREGRLDRAGRRATRGSLQCHGCGGGLGRAHRYGVMEKANVSASSGPGAWLLTAARLP